LTVWNTKRLPSVGAGADAAEGAKAQRACLVGRLRVAAFAVGLADLDQRVVDRVAVAVDHAAFQANALAGGVVERQHGVEGLVEVVAVLRGGEAVGEVGAHGLRGGLAEVGFLCAHQWHGVCLLAAQRFSNGVSSAPRSTMSNW
jgi:hypothetical protein